MNYNPFSLENKTILVTGASSGIGRATAIECSRMGAHIILTARNEEQLNTTLSMMDGTGHIVIPADLTIDDDVTRLIDTIPSLDGVAYVAGITTAKGIKFYTKKKIQEIFDTNTIANVYLTRCLLKAKKINKNASLVFISSVASHIITCIGNGIYSMSKAAVEAFSRQCALELIDREIRSNAILPGMIDTDLIQNDGALDLYRAEDEKHYIGGHYGNPTDIAYMTVYLLSDAARFVTGASLVIDGGRNLTH